jgi:hypothetical protein
MPGLCMEKYQRRSQKGDERKDESTSSTSINPTTLALALPFHGLELVIRELLPLPSRMRAFAWEVPGTFVAGRRREKVGCDQC